MSDYHEDRQQRDLQDRSEIKSVIDTEAEAVMAAWCAYHEYEERARVMKQKSLDLRDTFERTAVHGIHYGVLATDKETTIETHYGKLWVSALDKSVIAMPVYVAKGIKE